MDDAVELRGGHDATAAAAHGRDERGQRGDVPGDDQPRAGGRNHLQGHAPARAGARGRLRPRARRRHCRHGRRLRNAQGRLQGAGARVQRSRRRPQLDPARRRQVHRTRRRDPDCQFDQGLYINPGPWRLPHHHHGILDYCRQFGVALENFVQVNHNAYLHSPRRLRRQAAALPAPCSPITTAMSPSCWPSRRKAGQLDAP